MNIRRTQALTYALYAAFLLSLGAWGVSPVHAQQAPAPHPATATAPKPPTITDAQKAAYWKAVALQGVHQTSADIQSKQDTTAVQQSVQAMVAACGPDATLQQAPNGDPECVAKPEVKK